jgi:hypothetical protein
VYWRLVSDAAVRRRVGDHGIDSRLHAVVLNRPVASSTDVRVLGMVSSSIAAPGRGRLLEERCRSALAAGCPTAVGNGRLPELATA